MNETAPRWERLRTRSSPDGLNNSRPSPAGARPGSTPPLNEGDPPCSFPPWPPGPRQGWAAGSDRFWLLELRVSRTFLDQLRPQLFRPWIPNSARHRRWTRMIHRGRARRTISAGSWFGQWSPDPPSSATAALPAPDRWRVTWRPPLSRMAGPGDPRRTSPRPSARHLETSGRPNGGVGRPCPTSAINPRGKETCVNRNFAACQARAAWRASGCLCAPGFAFLLKPIG